MRWTSLQKLSITTGAALVLLGLSGGVSYYYASRLMAADSAVRQTNENITTAFQIVVSTHDAELATKAYVVRADSSARTSLMQAQSSVEDAIDAMNQVSEDNPRQRQLLERLVPQVAASFSEFRTTLAIRDHAGADSARRYLMRESLPHEADSLRKIVGEMRNEELRVLAERTRHRNTTGATALRIILLGTALTFLLAGLALQPMRKDVAERLTSSIWRSRAGATAHNDPAGGLHASAAELLKSLQGAAAVLAVAPDSAGGARALVDAGTGAFAAALAAVVVPSGAGGYSVLHASRPVLDSIPPDLARAVADALRTGAPLVASSRAERERQCGMLAVLDSLDAPGALLVVPLRRGAIVDGVLLLAFAGDHEFGTDELAFAETLGLLGGTAVASRPPTS